MTSAAFANPEALRQSIGSRKDRKAAKSAKKEQNRKVRPVTSASSLALALLVALCWSLPASAERLSDAELRQGWSVDGFVGANAFLTGTSDWAGGGGNAGAASVFADLRSVFDLSLVFLDFRLQAEYGFVKSPKEPLRKGVDEFDMEAYHVWQISPVVNPYIRITGDSRFTSSDRIFNTPQQVTITDEEGAVRSLVTDELEVTSPFAPTLFGEALGAHFTIIANEKGTFTAMTGFGGRQLVVDEFLVENDDEDTAAVEFFQREGYSAWGPELCLDLRYRPVEGLALASNLDFFYSVDSEVVLEWKSTISYQIWRILFVRGVFELQYDQHIVDRVQLRQNLMLSVAFRLQDE